MNCREISIIIPTYNRCPFSISEYYKNPLIWSLLSIINSNLQNLHKLIIVDDNSTDFTEENVEKIKREFEDVNIVYVKLNKRYNASIVRNYGLKYVDSKYVFFMDDDCIIYPNVIENALKAYKTLDKKVKLGALHFPVYLRKDTYDGVIVEKEIGKLYAKDGKIFSNFRMYPIEKKAQIKIDEELYIDAPVEIDFFHEVFLITTALIKKVGGFCENMKLKSILSEGLYLAMKMRKYNLHHYQIVDPLFKIIHFRYGSFQDSKIDETYKNIVPIPQINLSLEQMIKMSNIKNTSTGGRTNTLEIIKESISSRYAVFLYLDKEGAAKWGEYTYNALLNNVDDKMLKFPQVNIDVELKEKLWQDAIKQGREIYEQQLF